VFPSLGVCDLFMLSLWVVVDFGVGVVG